MDTMRVGAIQILRLRRRVAADVRHVSSLVVSIVLLVEVGSRLHFDAIWYLVNIAFLRILGELLLDISWRLIISVQLRKSRLLSEGSSILIRKHKGLAGRIFGRAHALSGRHLLPIVRLEDATHNLLALGRDPSPRGDKSFAWIL